MSCDILHTNFCNNTLKSSISVDAIIVVDTNNWINKVKDKMCQHGIWTFVIAIA